MAKKTTRNVKTTRNAQKRETLHLLIVESRFYDHIADALLDGAKRVLNAAEATYDILTVPGALEVPAAIVMALDTPDGKRAPYDGVVALGCVIQGETYHFDLVSNESARGLMDIAMNRQVPLGNGILTVDTEAQAQARTTSDDSGKGNKGAGAARAALAMVALKRSLKGK